MSRQSFSALITIEAYAKFEVRQPIRVSDLKPFTARNLCFAVTLIFDLWSFDFKRL